MENQEFLIRDFGIGAAELCGDEDLVGFSSLSCP